MFDQIKADNAVRFLQHLKHSKGKWAGVRFELLPWQDKIVRDIFGTVRADGLRQYRTAYVEIPRKAGKSHLAAGIALDCLFADGEAGGEVYLAATDRDQASIVFGIAAEMVRSSPTLRSRAKIIDSSRRIIVTKGRSSGSVLRAIPADAPGAHGFNASAVIYDELHAAPNRELWDVLTTSVGAREQPLSIAITTAGFDRESICWELHEFSRQILEGVIEEPTFYPVIFAAAESDNWKDPAVWAKANPSLGTSVSLDYYESECRKAQQLPAEENRFRRLLLNQWTTQDSRWIPIDRWDASAGTVDPATLRARPVYAGLDLSTTTDLSALALVFPPDREDGEYKALFHFWIPEAKLAERSRIDRVPYESWAGPGGYVTATPGNVVDYAYIRRDLNALGREFPMLREIAFDPWNATHLALDLESDGFTMVQVRQGFASLSAPTKELERLILETRLHHGGNPVMRWMANNVAIKQDAAGNLKPDKSKSTDRIDGVIALVMGLDRASRHLASTYESHRLFVL